jgi:hypothetical protein
MKINIPLQIFGVSLCLSLGSPAEELRFTKTHLIDDFWAEGATVGDFNHDGTPDVAYGPWWFAGPDYKEKHEYFPATATWNLMKPDGTVETKPGYMGAKSPKNGYSNAFLAFTDDFNGDGWDDILVIGFPGKETYWYENPRDMKKSLKTGAGLWCAAAAVFSDTRCPPRTGWRNHGRGIRSHPKARGRNSHMALGWAM